MVKRSASALAFVLLVTAGSTQMLGDVFALPRLKAFGAATQIAPAMKVFTAQQGFETHANRFFLAWQAEDGVWRERQLDPGLYAGLRGPYNRRNVYGAALAYGPLLRADARTRPMHDSVMRYAFCEPGSLFPELGLGDAPRRLRMRVEPVLPPARDDLELEWEFSCHG